MHQFVVPPPQELDRLSLELVLPALVLVEDGPGRGAKGAVVQEADGGIQQEFGFEIRHVLIIEQAAHRPGGTARGAIAHNTCDFYPHFA